MYFGAVCSCSSGEGGEGEEEEGASTVLKQPSKVCRLVPVCQGGWQEGAGRSRGGEVWGTRRVSEKQTQETCEQGKKERNVEGLLAREKTMHESAKRVSKISGAQGVLEIS